MSVQSLGTLQLNIWRRHPAVAVLLFVRKRPGYPIWEKSDMLGEGGGQFHLGMAHSQAAN